MQKLAIIGASEFQNPLILKAREKGVETHVFAWEAGDVGERTADVFHPISTLERAAVLEECRRLAIDGICSIATDVGNACVGYVSNALGLPGNPPECVRDSTDKSLMRACFAAHGVPSPRFAVVRPGDEPDLAGFSMPLMVKATDRSGSRGVTRVDRPEGIGEALRAAFDAGFNQTAVIEEYVEGREFCVEHFSWEGRHTFLALTEKWTSGSPHYIESGHLQPGRVEPDVLEQIKRVCAGALDALGMRQGASCPEVMVQGDGTVKVIEVGTRMAGEYMGSHAVPLSTGVDYVGAVVDAALGRAPDLAPRSRPYGNVVIKCVMDAEDARIVEAVERAHPSWVRVRTDIAPFDREVLDSSDRFGYLVLAADEEIDVEALRLGVQ